MARKDIEKITDNLQQALDVMRLEGADFARAVFNAQQETIVKVSKGVVEKLEAAKPVGLSLYMRKGERAEALYLNSLKFNDLTEAVSRLSAAVDRMPDNIYSRPVDVALLSKHRDHRGLDLIDRKKITLDKMMEDARVMEDAALSVAGVTHTKGATAARSRSLMVSLDSRGIRFISERTGSSLSVAVIAQHEDDQCTGGEGAGRIHYEDLPSPQEMGRTAGIEAVQSLNPGSAKTGVLPVVFHPDIGASLLGHFAGAISGGAVRTKTSFLMDAMHKAVFSPAIQIRDNPLIKRGLGSCLYTDSGLPAAPLTLVEDGVLQNWFLKMEDARRMGLENAAQVRGPTNLTIEPSTISPADLISDIKDGLYVTGLMGQGVDSTNGQYSRAATGFVIENGRVDYTRPVANAIISSNLKDMFKNMSVASDLDRARATVGVPTIRVEGMHIS